MNGRRVFEQVSAALAKIRPTESASDRTFETWEECCIAVADTFAAMNQAFERERFMRDCGAYADLPNDPDAALRALVLEHGKAFGSYQTKVRLIEVGASQSAPTLANVPRANLEALRARLTKDLGATPDSGGASS